MGSIFTLNQAVIPDHINSWASISRYIRYSNMVVLFEQSYVKITEEIMQAMEGQGRAYFNLKESNALSEAKYQGGNYYFQGYQE